MLVNKIKKLCEENGIPIRTLESSIGLGNGAISKWNESSPSVYNILKICMYFDITPNELLGYKEVKEIFLESRIEKLELKVEKLEKNQLESMKEVHDYINNSEAIANMQQKEIESLPGKLRELLTSVLNQ